MADKTLSRKAKSTKPATKSNCERRGVPLKFWLGHKTLWATTFPMEVQNLLVDPLGEDCPDPPDLTALAPELAGIYRSSEPLTAIMPSLKVSSTGIRYIESRFQRRFIDMRTDFKGFMSHFSGKTRSTIKRKVRKFGEASGGEIRWSAYRSVSEMERFHSLAREISELTYQEKLFNAGLPTDESFLAEMHEDAKSDAVRGFILFFAERPVSYLYLPIRDERVIYGYLGFNPSFAKHSPGTVLQFLALEYLFSENRYQFFDFTEGEGVHKKTFSTHERSCGNVYYLRATLRNQCLVRLHLLVRGLSQFANDVLVKTGLKDKLRRILRGQTVNG